VLTLKLMLHGVRGNGNGRLQKIFQLEQKVFYLPPIPFITLNICIELYRTVLNALVAKELGLNS